MEEQTTEQNIPVIGLYNRFIFFPKDEGKLDVDSGYFIQIGNKTELYEANTENKTAFGIPGVPSSLIERLVELGKFEYHEDSIRKEITYENQNPEVVICTELPYFLQSKSHIEALISERLKEKRKSEK